MSSTQKVLKIIANVLIGCIMAIMFLHIHVLCFFLCCLKDDVMGNIVVNFGFLITPSIVVILVNAVGDFYDEIQSWEIAYILWGVFVAVIGNAEELWIYRSKSNRRDAMLQFYKMTLYPFGIKPREVGDNALYTYPLISLAPAIIGGYIANFFLETRYSLECDENIYDSVSDMCEGDLCCVTVSSHDELIDFIPGLASSILAAWGTVKALGTFIAVYSDTVTLQEYVDTAELKEEVTLLKEQVKLLTVKMDVTKTDVVEMDEEMAGRTTNIQTNNAEKDESMNKES